MDVFNKGSHWQKGDTPEGTGTNLSGGMTIGIGALVLLLVVVAGFALFGRGTTEEASTSSPSASAPAVVVVTPTTIPATPTPSCVSVSTTYLPMILELENRGKFEVAAENITIALQTEHLCTEEREILAQKYVTDSLDALYNLRFSPAKGDQEDCLERYQTIQQQAKRYDVPMPRPLLVAQRAASTGKFLLALAAYDSAWEDGSFTAADQALIRDYVSNLYNVGDWWTRNKADPNFEEGLTYLLASYHLEQKHKTGQAEAWGRLTELLGPDQTKWPAPKKTPLL